jgi:nucleoside-diphosphate-sugar epimerase
MTDHREIARIPNRRTFLVTGCAGFIGSVLSEALVARGDAVIGVDRFTDYYPRRLKEANLAGLTGHPSFRFVETCAGDVEELVTGCDGVFHLAAQPGVRGSWGATFDVYARENVLATQRLFDAAAREGRRVVWASSSSVYGNAETYPTREDARPQPVSPYGVTKSCCEQLADAYRVSFGLDHVGLRYFTVYGPRQRPDMAYTRIADALRDGTEFTVLGSGRQSRDVTYIGDAVTATMLAMDRAPGGIFLNVGGGSEVSLLDAIRLAEGISGRRLRVRHEGVAAGDVRRTSADTTRLREATGWRPETSIETGLRAHLEWAGAALGGAAA